MSRCLQVSRGWSAAGAQAPHMFPVHRCFRFIYSQPGWSAGSRDDLWRDLAAQKWPRQTLRLSPYYTTYKVSAYLPVLTKNNCQGSH